jgi:protein phosphatase
VKDLDQAKISVRSFTLPVDPDKVPEIEMPRDPLVKANGASGDPGAGDDVSPRLSGPFMDDPIEIPTEGAPTWLVIMMIASAVACVTIAVWFLFNKH